MKPFPSEIAAHAAGAHAYAAEVFRGSPHAGQRAFAPVLDTWAANALARADQAQHDQQQDLFA